MTLPKQPTLPIRRIVQGKNPRTYFDPVKMKELEDGIRAVGVIQPIVVRPIPGTDLFEIIAGERRWRAAKNVFGDDYEIPVTVQEAGDAQAEAMAVIENHHRADMSAAEEAHAAQRQLQRNRGDREETARAMGWSADVLDRRLALLACTPTVLQALTERRILIGHAELLSGIPPDKQDLHADRPRHAFEGVVRARQAGGGLADGLGHDRVEVDVGDRSALGGLPFASLPHGDGGGRRGEIVPHRRSP